VISVGDLAVRHLRDAGVRFLFGMPGGGSHLDLLEAESAIGRKRSASERVNIAVFTPMPCASETIAAAVNAGLRRGCPSAWRIGLMAGITENIADCGLRIAE
jgi:hypothetical protein